MSIRRQRHRPVDLIDGIGGQATGETQPVRKPETALESGARKVFPEGIPGMGADVCAHYGKLRQLGARELRLQRAEGYRNFCSKIWNATNFVLMNTKPRLRPRPSPLAYTRRPMDYRPPATNRGRRHLKPTA